MALGSFFSFFSDNTSSSLHVFIFKFPSVRLLGLSRWTIGVFRIRPSFSRPTIVQDESNSLPLRFTDFGQYPMLLLQGTPRSPILPKCLMHSKTFFPPQIYMFFPKSSRIRRPLFFFKHVPPFFSCVCFFLPLIVFSTIRSFRIFFPNSHRGKTVSFSSFSLKVILAAGPPFSSLAVKSCTPLTFLLRVR